MFKITQHKGFQLTFPNGWTVSVQWGPGNYCGNREEDWDSPAKSKYWECPDAEVAAFDSVTGAWYRPKGWSDDVKGWLDTEEVLAFLAEVKALEPYSPEKFPKEEVDSDGLS